MLRDRGELARESVLRLCGAAYADAFWLRTTREELRHALRSPALVLFAIVLALGAAAIPTGGYRRARALLRPLPVEDPGALVAIRFTGTAADPSGVPANMVPLWRAHSTLLRDVAGFTHVRYHSHASVTTNFFSVLGTRAVVGRTFRPGETDTAVLGYNAWRTMFSADQRVVGSKVKVDGKEYTLVGVLPESFWAISGGIAIWTPLILEPRPAPDVPFLIGAVGRTKSGADIRKLRMELVEVAKKGGYLLPRAPQVIPFEAIPERRLLLYLFWIGFAIVAGIVPVALRGASLCGKGWRYWAFLAAKLVGGTALVSLLWIEAGEALHTGPPYDSIGLVLAVIGSWALFLVSFAIAMWWSFADQRSRCPVCLQRMALPVSLGSPASVFDPSKIEMLCEAGHGALCLTETADRDGAQWTALDASWREFFETAKTPPGEDEDR